MKKFNSCKELNEAIKPGEIKKGEFVILDEREISGNERGNRN